MPQKCWPTRQTPGHYGRWLVGRSAVPLNKNEELPNQQPGRVTSTYRTCSQNTTGFRESQSRSKPVCLFSPSKNIYHLNWDSTCRRFFKVKDFKQGICSSSPIENHWTKKNCVLLSRGLFRQQNAKLQSLLTCHAWQVAGCLGSSWNAFSFCAVIPVFEKKTSCISYTRITEI